jgi:Hemerythrin HHE cation binding domain
MTRSDAPADTRMMGIVHAALQRDVSRAREVLRAAPPPRDRQRVALGGHVVWLMDFLHGHHSGEDEGLWPLVRARNPAAAPLLDSMEADHARIAPEVEAVTVAARDYATTTSDGPTEVLARALDRLVEVLFPHLDREVAEAMPVVAASITDREWDAVEQKHFVKNKSMRELGLEGHWLLDGIDAEGYQIVVHTVPAIPRFVLVHGFARAYRRQAAARWGSVVPQQRTARR